MARCPCSSRRFQLPRARRRHRNIGTPNRTSKNIGRRPACSLRLSGRARNHRGSNPRTLPNLSKTKKSSSASRPHRSFFLSFPQEICGCSCCYRRVREAKPLNQTPKQKGPLPQNQKPCQAPNPSGKRETPHHHWRFLSKKLGIVTLLNPLFFKQREKPGKDTGWPIHAHAFGA